MWTTIAHIFSAEKENKNGSQTSGRARKTRVQKIKAYLSKTAWTFIWTFERKVSKIRHFLKWLGFSKGSFFFARFCFIMLNTGRSDFRFLREKIYRHALAWSTSNQFVQNAAQFFFSPPLEKKPEYY